MAEIWTMPRPAVWAATGLAVLTLTRLYVAAVTPLAPDEAYYWIWSRALAPGYIDHPPMVALWIRAGTMLVGSNLIGVRLLGPFSAVVGSVLLYDAAERLFPPRRAGVTAVVLLNATLAFGAGSVIMTPDTPLLLFWTATLWAAARIVAGGSSAWWLAAGLFTGLALVSKYTALFLPIGLGVFLVLTAPRWLRRPEPWLGAVIAMSLFLPVVVWNARNGWIGFARQGGRVADWRPERAPGFLGELVAGQIGLATPGVFVLFAMGLAVAVSMTVRARDPGWSLLTAFSIPPALVFLQHAMGDRVQGNWPTILYPAAAIAAGGLTESVWRRLVWPSAALGFAIALVLYAHVVTAWPSIPADPVARQLFGWNEFAASAAMAGRREDAAFIAVEPYGLAAQLAWAQPDDTVVIGAGSHWTPTTLPRAGTGDTRGILIRPERYGCPDPVAWRDVVRLPSIARANGDAEIERYAVFQVRGIGPVGVALPHR